MFKRFKCRLAFLCLHFRKGLNFNFRSTFQTTPMNAFSTRQNGFSLIEMMLTLMVVGIISVIAFKQLYRRDGDVGGGERILQTASAKIIERRGDALRLRGEDRRLQVSVRPSSVAPLAINFADLQTTASLVIEGTDDDKDCTEDITGQPLTCLKIVGGAASWLPKYADNRLALPSGWRVAQNAGDLGAIPLIAGGANGRGVLVTAIWFTPTGSAVWLDSFSSYNLPAGTPSSSSAAPSQANSPFWAIYFVSSGSPALAVAVAVHPNGSTENFRWDGAQWIGYQNRTF